jgi:hypothetical protein
VPKNETPSPKKPAKDQADQDLDSLMVDMTPTIEGRYKELHSRSESRYDGVLGTLPDLWPQHFHIEFEDARNQLLNKLSHREILTYLTAYALYFKPDYDGRPRFPIQYTKLIGTLHYYKKARSRGEIKGLEWLAGKDAAAGFRSRNAHKNREKSPDEQDVQAIAKDIWRENPDATIAGIIRSPALAPYRKIYKDKKTLRSWLSSIDPRPPEQKRGRPKKKN